jgi:hypothetical protein
MAFAKSKNDENTWWAYSVSESGLQLESHEHALPVVRLETQMSTELTNRVAINIQTAYHETAILF